MAALLGNVLAIINNTVVIRGTQSDECCSFRKGSGEIGTLLPPESSASSSSRVATNA